MTKTKTPIICENIDCKKKVVAMNLCVEHYIELLEKSTQQQNSELEELKQIIANNPLVTMQKELDDLRSEFDSLKEDVDSLESRLDDACLDI